jgi:hypothetical protein
VRPRKPSAATIIATLALLLALGGTAVAASRYIITSTSQIKPSVLEELRGTGGALPPVPAADGGAHAIVARARSVGPVASATEAAVADPLSGAVWTQHAEELEQILGRVTITSPSYRVCSTGPSGGSTAAHAVVSVLLDGSDVGRAELGNRREVEVQAGSPETETVTRTLSWTPENDAPDYLLWEPGKATSHTLTAQVRDDCGEGGGSTGGHFTIDSVSIDVLGER